jgi:hypothetical protein
VTWLDEPHAEAEEDDDSEVLTTDALRVVDRGA